MDNLGKMVRIDDLRTVWKHEEYDFSKWLAEDENLAELGAAIGINMVLNELESSVGNFNVDMFASEEGTNRKIIIENQLEDTNHDHFGKIITYAAGKSAEIIIWIVKRARDEHCQAIEWLNQHTDENIGFFLVELELWKVDQSLPAVKFNVVERPNDWAKTLKVVGGLTDTQKLQLNFWQSFIEYAFANEEFKKVFSKRKPYPQSWYSLSVGNSSFYISLTAVVQRNVIGAEIYICNQKELFKKYKSRKTEIEAETGLAFEWKEANKDCRILTTTTVDIKNLHDWNKYFSWLCEKALILKKVISKYN
jgi:hypothetical protein